MPFWGCVDSSVIHSSLAENSLPLGKFCNVTEWATDPNYPINGIESGKIDGFLTSHLIVIVTYSLPRRDREEFENESRRQCSQSTKSHFLIAKTTAFQYSEKLYRKNLRTGIMRSCSRLQRYYIQSQRKLKATVSEAVNRDNSNAKAVSDIKNKQKEVNTRHNDAGDCTKMPLLQKQI